jgi:hypothetical protein
MPREIRAARPGCAADEHSPAGRCLSAAAVLVRELGLAFGRGVDPAPARVLVAAGRVPAEAGAMPAPEHPAAPSASAVVISRAGPGHGRRIVITLLRKR